MSARRSNLIRPALGLLAPLAAALALAGCVNLSPDLQRPAGSVPASLPAGDAAQNGSGSLPAADALVQDARLRELLALALKNNRDLRVALLNVERSRAQLGLADADRWPTLNAALIAQRTPNTSTGKPVNSFQAGLQVSSFELDLLGRVKNLDDAAAATLLGSEAGLRSARLALQAQVVTAWLTLAADDEQLRLARSTLASREETLKLTQLRDKVGSASAIELQAALSLTASARASLAQLERQRAQDANALDLVVGAPVPANLRPDAPLGTTDWLAKVPAGLSSDVLLQRPDVIQAEQTMRSANANIGAARAALWPRITLSGQGGQASSRLSELFDPGHFAFTLAANAGMALFDAGRNQANIAAATASRDIALAQYEKAVQTAFREASDALVAQGSLATQRQAQQDLRDATAEQTRLARLKLKVGAASVLDTLDAERQLASAEQALVQVRLAELLNRLALWKALGGGEAVAAEVTAAR